jgi:hypothetical protein
MLDISNIVSQRHLPLGQARRIEEWLLDQGFVQQFQLAHAKLSSWRSCHQQHQLQRAIAADNIMKPLWARRHDGICNAEKCKARPKNWQAGRVRFVVVAAVVAAFIAVVALVKDEIAAI